MFKRLDVVVAILFIHSGITEAELSCQTETEDVQTIRLSLVEILYLNLNMKKTLMLLK